MAKPGLVTRGRQENSYTFSPFATSLDTSFNQQNLGHSPWSHWPCKWHDFWLGAWAQSSKCNKQKLPAPFTAFAIYTIFPRQWQANSMTITHNTQTLSSPFFIS